MERGDLIARGRTSDVYAWGVDSVVKVLRADVPPAWAGLEARHTRAVRSLGLPAPEVRGLVEVDGRQGVIFERIFGLSMWQEMCADTGASSVLAEVLADVHGQILSAGLPDNVTGLVSRMQGKITEATQLPVADRSTASQVVAELPRGAALLHGDLHPGNVLMSVSGPVVIDWFDASIGHPVADVVRSSLLLRSHLSLIHI